MNEQGLQKIEPPYRSKLVGAVHRSRSAKPAAACAHGLKRTTALWVAPLDLGLEPGIALGLGSTGSVD